MAYFTQSTSYRRHSKGCSSGIPDVRIDADARKAHQLHIIAELVGQAVYLECCTCSGLQIQSDIAVRLECCCPRDKSNHNEKRACSADSSHGCLCFPVHATFRFLLCLKFSSKRGPLLVQCFCCALAHSSKRKAGKNISGTCVRENLSSIHRHWQRRRRHLVSTDSAHVSTRPSACASLWWVAAESKNTVPYTARSLLPRGHSLSHNRWTTAKHTYTDSALLSTFLRSCTRCLRYSSCVHSELQAVSNSGNPFYA